MGIGRESLKAGHVSLIVAGARLEIPIDPAWTPAAQSFVEQASLRYGMNPEQAQSLAAASGPLFEVLLGQEFHDHDPTLQLFCRLLPGGLEIVVVDQGLPFDPQMWTRPEVAARLQWVQRQLDKLEFANLGLQGKETRLLKYFAVRPEDEHHPSDAEEQPHTPLRDIRLFEAADAQAVSRCVWRTYGYSYSVLDAVYIPERLIALNQEGLMRSLVAVNEVGDVIGHIAYERTSPCCSLVTAGVAAVEPAYRCQGVASKMAHKLMLQAVQDGVQEMQCYAVTSHPYSQRLAHSLGFRSCSLVLGASILCFEGMETTGNQRESMVGYYQALNPEVLKIERPLYAPNRHRGMLESLCNNLGLQVHFKTAPKVELTTDEPVLVLKESPPRKTAKIHVEKYGSFILERIRSHARYLRLQDYRCFQLTLPLQDPYTFHILKPLEKMGFFFSGLQFRPIGLCLLLQDLYGVTIDYRNMTVEDEMGRELLGYVRYLEPQSV